MTDRELLELAAKAAGINGWFIEDDEWLGTGITFTDENDCNQCWNPLTDDGDALRLAVKLEMEVNQSTSRVKAPDRSHVKPRYVVVPIEDDDDPYAATRRAIVRAAAEIGKEMK